MSNIKDSNSTSLWNIRIWDGKKNQWLCDREDDVLPYYGFDIRGGELTSMQSMDWVYNQFAHGRELIWEHSTGLKDNNGKEMYEGDILEFTTVKLEYVKKARRGIVVFHEGTFCVYDNVYIALDRINNPRWHRCVVVGNIHENPELLEDKSGEN